MKIRLKIIAALLPAVLAAGILLLPMSKNEEEYLLPVLLYHHFDEAVAADTVVSPKRFREQMTALKDAGYTTVTLRQIAEFVDCAIPLPEKAVLITMDDGYTSNLTVAAPILEELGMCATVFLIGIYEGETISPHTGNPLYPARFAWEDAAQWVEKGVLELQSHTYDMHQRAGDGFSGRDGILPLAGESYEDYRAALGADAEAFAAKLAGHDPDAEIFALAYPYGFFCGEAREPLAAAGIRFTFTVEEKLNRLQVGDGDCLWNMGRLNVTNRDSGDELIRRLSGRGG